MSNPESNKPADEYRLSASIGKASFRFDEPVRVNIIFENVSSHELPYGVQAREFDYLLECRNEQGQVMPATLYGQRVEANRGEGRFIRSTLAPGDRLVNEITVNRLLDLTLAGHYTLHVRRDVFPHQGGNQKTLLSNPCSFQITDA